jgi:GAF domain-containing protein/HAMP domain-containing protein
VLLIGLITTPLIVLLFGAIAVLVGNALEEAGAAQLAYVNRGVSGNVQTWLDQNVKTLNALAALPDIAKMDPAQQKAVLRALDGAYPDFDLFSTAGFSGKNIARSDNGELLDYSSRSWFQQTAKTGVPAFHTEISLTSGKPALTIAVPIRGADGQIIGVLMGSTDLTNLPRLIEISRIGSTGFTYLVDNLNNVVAHPDAALTTGDSLTQLSEAPAIKAIRTGQTGFFAFDEGDQHWHANINRLSNGWGVIVQQQEAEFLALYNGFVIAAGALSIVTLLVLVAVTWWAVGRALQPITALTEVAVTVSEGDFSRTAPVARYDEVGVLASVFNSMTASLRDLVTSLEHRVEARTAQLRASSEVGRAAVSILDSDQLLGEVVNLITDRFGFYYAAIFLIDDAGEWAILRAATGEAGQALKDRGHRLATNGQSMVGAVVRSRHARIALDVGTEAVRFANPLLPDTRSEVALPLIVGGQVLGVLDVQSAQAAAFDDASAVVLQAMADQIAVALSNTFQFQQTQAALLSSRRQNDVNLALTQAEDAASLLYALVAYAIDGVDRAVLLTYGPEDEFGRFTYAEVIAGWTSDDTDSLTPPGARLTAEQLPFLTDVKPGQPVVVHDTTGAGVKEEYWRTLADWKVQALAALSLAVGDRKLGALVFAYRRPHRFTEAELDSLQTYARQTAVILRNRQLVNESQTALRQIDEINRRLTGEAWEEYRASLSQPLRQISWRQGLPEATGDGQAASVAAPVIVNGVEIGLLRLEDQNPDHVWPEEDLSLLAAVASEVSIAVEKARLVEETERRAQLEQTINRITSRIRNAASIDQMLALAAREVRAELQATRTIAEIAPEASRDQRATE